MGGEKSVTVRCGSVINTTRMHTRLCRLRAGAIFFIGLVIGSVDAAPVAFNRDIRPILSENCLTCHGPDKNKRKAGLRLDQEEVAKSKLESGHVAIVPGKPEESRMIYALTTTDADDQMPPAKTGKKLSREQIDLIQRWIAEGAPFEKHWAYIPPVRPEPPAVKQTDWAHNEIDRFILARLEKEGLKPSPPAEKHALLRRVTVDLTGLPPTIDEVDAFLADTSADAYEKVVDRLLASQAYGERMAQQWLDLARYADSDGYHADVPRSMWQYRDYVINSFNKNKPFDQFTVEQLAGDMLPNATLEQKVATAFNRNGMSSTEGGADPDEYMAKYVTDRVNTTATVWLGTSINCTECHDHKYDPFTQREYYQLFDFFNRLPEKGLDSDPAPPFVKAPSDQQQSELAQIKSDRAVAKTKRDELLNTRDEKLDAAGAAWAAALRQKMAKGWTALPPVSTKSANGATLGIQADDSIAALGANPEKDIHEVTFRTSRSKISALQLEALLGPGQTGASRGNGNFVLTGFEAEIEPLSASDPALRPVKLGAWKSLGPFPAASGKEAFDKKFIDEEKLDLNASYADGKIKWTEHADWKDGEAHMLPGSVVATYLTRTIIADAARPLVISLGSDDGLQVWINGKKVLSREVSRGVAPDQDRAFLSLQPGENQLLLKINDGGGDHGFYFAAVNSARMPVRFVQAAADYQQKDFPASAALDENAETGWAIDGYKEDMRKPRTAVFIPSDPFGFADGTLVRVKLKFESKFAQHVIGRWRLSGREDNVQDFSALPENSRTALLGAESPEKVAALRDDYREEHLPGLKENSQKIASLEKAEADLDKRIPTIRVMEDMPKPDRVTKILVRGDYRNKGDVVSADVPKTLPPLPADAPRNRLSFAKWLVDPRHPLVGRVTVNRFWSLYFGTGLVKTGNEFGSQGEPPSHPELLDWLAREFIDTGWNIKAMHKRIVLSATYQQSSKATPELIAKDSQNRLLARGPRFRMAAETIRDNALSYSGLLDRARKPGGPSVRPYQPPGLWETMMFGGNKYEVGKGDELWRRSIYTLWKRTVPYPMFKTFDAPDRAICTEQRGMTCTPLQAFVTLNEQSFVEAARVFAQRILQQGGAETPAQLRFAVKTVLSRDPSDKELETLSKILGEMRTEYTLDPKAAEQLVAVGEAKRPENLDTVQLAAWTTVANVLLNLDETMTKE